MIFAKQQKYKISECLTQAQNRAFAKRHLKKELVRSFPIQVKENNNIAGGSIESKNRIFQHNQHASVQGNYALRDSNLCCSLSGDKKGEEE